MADEKKIKKGDEVGVIATGIVVSVSKDEIIVAVASQTRAVKPSDVDETSPNEERQVNPALARYHEATKDGQSKVEYTEEELREQRIALHGENVHPKDEKGGQN